MVRYRIQTMCYPDEQWAVWDNEQRREVSWHSHDRKAVVAKVRALNTGTVDIADVNAAERLALGIVNEESATTETEPPIVEARRLAEVSYQAWISQNPEMKEMRKPQYHDGFIFGWTQHHFGYVFGIQTKSMLKYYGFKAGWEGARCLSD